MKKIFLLLFLLRLLAPTQAQDCTPRDFERLMADAKRLAKAGEYDKAINKLQSAKTCQPQREGEVSAEILRVFEQVNRERKRAEEQTKIAQKEKEKTDSATLNIYANDLAFKSKIALEKGERSTALRLADFASRFVDPNNRNVRLAIIGCLYYNDNRDKKKLPWGLTLTGHMKSPYFNDSPGFSIYSFIGVNCLAFSPDGTKLATGGNDETVKIWDFEKGRLETTLSLPKYYGGSVNSIAYSPTERKLVTGNQNATVRIWDFESKNVISEFNQGSYSFVKSVTYSSDGEQLFIASENTPLKLIELNSGNYLDFFHNIAPIAQYVKVSPSGSLLAAAVKNDIKIWDIYTGKELFTLLGCDTAITGVSFSKNEKQLASVSNEKYCRVWDLNTGRVSRTLEGHDGKITSVAFSPLQDQIATASADNTIKIWDLETGIEVTTLRGHHGPINCLTYSNDGTKLATGSQDNTTILWDLNMNHEAYTLSYDKSNIRNVFFAPNSREAIIVSNTNEFTVNVFDTFSGKRCFGLKTAQKSVGAALSPNGEKIVLTFDDHTAQVWNIETRKQIFTLVGHSAFVWCAAFSPDGKLVATGSSDKTVKIWDIETGKEVCTLIGHSGEIRSVAFSPNSKTIATGSTDKTVIIWDLETKKELQIFTGFSAFAFAVVFTPDGKKLITGYDFNSLKLWDVESGKVYGTLSGHDSFILSVAISPDGKTLASGSEDTSIRIWNTETCKVEAVLKGHTGYIRGLSFSSDGKRLLSGASDGKVKIWDFDIDCWKLLSGRNRLLSPIQANQLEEYSLENLLDIHPNNESILLATRETWQIAAFADIYTQKIAQTGFPQKADYERAQRLYRACLSHNVDNAYFQQKIDDLERLWKEKNN